MPLPRGALFARIEDALPVHVVLLLDLPQDRGRRRLRHQHHGRGRQPQGARTHRGLSRHARRRGAALLRQLRDGAMGLGQAMAAVGVSLRLGDRYAAAAAEGAQPHLPRLARQVGAYAPGQALQGLSARGHHRLARATRIAQAVMEFLARLDPRLLIAGIAFAGLLIALPFFVASMRRLRRLRLVGGTFYLLISGIVLLTATAACLVAVNLLTYARLTHEQEAARVTTRQ